MPPVRVTAQASTITFLINTFLSYSAFVFPISPGYGYNVASLLMIALRLLING